MIDRSVGTEALPASAAVERLAERLYWNMQRLDPDLEAPEWQGLTDRQRRFYRLLVADLAAFDGLLRAARGDRSVPATQQQVG